jgi:hypothetical protein
MPNDHILSVEVRDMGLDYGRANTVCKAAVFKFPRCMTTPQDGVPLARIVAALECAKTIMPDESAESARIYVPDGVTVAIEWRDACDPLSEDDETIEKRRQVIDGERIDRAD